MQYRLLSLLVIAAAANPFAHAAIYDITRYGAVNGADSTTAIQNAVNDASADHGTLYIPTGTYYVSAALSNASAQKGFMVKGDGMNSVLCLTSGTDLFDLSFRQSTEHLTVTNVALTTSSANAQTALRIVYPSTPGFHTDSAAQIDSITIGTTGAGQWSCGVSFAYAWNSMVRDSTFTNANLNPYAGTAIAINKMSVNVLFVSNNLSNWSTGIGCNDYEEGLLIDGGQIGPVHTGFAYTYGASEMVWLGMHNVTLDCRQDGASGIRVDGSGGGTICSLIRGNTFNIAEDIPNQTPASPRYHYVGLSEITVFSNNAFNGQNSAGGVVLKPTNGYPALVNRNTFLGIANGASLWLQPGVSSTLVDDNGFNGGWFFDQGTNTHDYFNY